MDHIPYSLSNVDANTAVLHLAGACNDENHSLFRGAISSAIEAGCKFLLLDLSEVNQVTWVGIGAIVSGLRRIQHRSGALAIIGPQIHVRRLLETARIHLLVPIFDTQEDALHWCHGAV